MTDSNKITWLSLIRVISTSNKLLRFGVAEELQSNLPTDLETILNIDTAIKSI